ncbi:alkene reductase [Paraburkholderia sp. DHOC27]|nr:alkene reductase [Paraburkholderia sp. DHOC27]
MENLFAPLSLGALELPNRIVMPPLTRMRAGAGGVPTPLSAKYYAQRATAGLIITEATAISLQAHGYPNMPGIYSREQIAGWSEVTRAVHENGGRIALQIVHSGRASHSSYNADGSLPVGPSAIAPSTGQAFTPTFTLVDFETPRPLEIAELSAIVEDFLQAAQKAIEAGFDAVELHAANGYLLDEFLQDGSNQRTDRYGGSIAGRSLLLIETVAAVSNAIGAERVGVRLSPHGNFNDMHDSDPQALFGHVIEQLNGFHLAYLHLIEPRSSSIGAGEGLSVDSANNAALFGRAYRGPVISAGGYDAWSGSAALANGHADAIGFGRMFIANPDLVQRIKVLAPLNDYDRNTFYGGAERGYTDYPRIETV